MNNNTPNSIPLVCLRENGAFNAGQQERYGAIRRQLATAVKESQELVDGYALRFVPEGSLIMALAEFITLERLCCGFFRFTLEVEAQGGPIWLRLSGPEGVKEFLKSELNL